MILYFTYSWLYNIHCGCEIFFYTMLLRNVTNGTSAQINFMRHGDLQRIAAH